MKRNILFITGTDTAVGKTTVCALLLANCLSRKINVRALKPVETGCSRREGNILHAADAELLAAVSSGTEHVLYRFASPVAPLVASRAEGPSIDYEALVSWVEKHATQAELTLVEGAGGLLVPLSIGKTFADLASELGMNVLVVVGSRLGALNHAALTFEALLGRDLHCLGYVLNDLFRANAEAQDSGMVAALDTNRSMLLEIAHEYDYEELCYLPALGNIGSAALIRQYAHREEIKKLADAVFGG